MKKTQGRLGLLGAVMVVLLAWPAAAQYVRDDLVSDGFISAFHIDPHLVNPWGIAYSPTGPFIIADNGTGVATAYDGSGAPFPDPEAGIVVAMPPGLTAPTGVVFNDTPFFRIRAVSRPAPSQFLFASEDGLIAGWNPNADPNNAITAVDNSASAAVYKGIALAKIHNIPFLYVTNFFAGVVEVYDKRFRPVGTFTDPDLPMGYAPFGIRNINNQLYVTFALQDEFKHDDVAGPGHGFVDVFDADGGLVTQLVAGGALNSPWGMAVAPSTFGPFSGALLIGNFGDGMINGYNVADGTPLGFLTYQDGITPIVLDGLWGLTFGNGFDGGDTDQLYFTSGPNHESDGLFGAIKLPD